ncbi:MAG: AMP-binding protein, partial [Gammaproteobacteria bacterium]
MSEKDSKQDSGNVISAHWRDEALIEPPPAFVEQANMNTNALHERMAEANFPECFDEYARLLDWSRDWDRTLDDSRPPFFRWFTGGELTACFNCVDRHLPAAADRAAYHFVPEDEAEPAVTTSYRELHRRVNELAAVLREDYGLQRGDRVTLHLPMTPELPIAMLACARLGVIHSSVFSGYSGQACADRIIDSGSRLLITMDVYRRGGKLIDHKPKADEAARQSSEVLEHCLVFRRYPGEYKSKSPMQAPRDRFADELLAAHRGAEVEPEPIR